jgi:hypothetical protein
MANPFSTNKRLILIRLKDMPLGRNDLNTDKGDSEAEQHQSIDCTFQADFRLGLDKTFSFVDGH